MPNVSSGTFEGRVTATTTGIGASGLVRSLQLGHVRVIAARDGQRSACRTALNLSSELELPASQVSIDLCGERFSEPDETTSLV